MFPRLGLGNSLRAGWAVGDLFGILVTGRLGDWESRWEMWKAPESEIKRAQLCFSDRKRERSEEKWVIFLFSNEGRGHLSDMKGPRMGKMDAIL